MELVESRMRLTRKKVRDERLQEIEDVTETDPILVDAMRMARGSVSQKLYQMYWDNLSLIIPFALFLLAWVIGSLGMQSHQIYGHTQFEDGIAITSICGHVCVIVRFLT